MLAWVAFVEISHSARARRLETFDRDLERVLGRDGDEFWLALRNLARA